MCSEGVKQWKNTETHMKKNVYMFEGNSRLLKNGSNTPGLLGESLMLFLI